MGSLIQYFIYIVVAYTIMGVFQRWISDFFSAFGMILGSVQNILHGVEAFLGFSIPSYVFLLYGSLIFVVVFRVLRSLYLNKSK